MLANSCEWLAGRILRVSDMVVSELRKHDWMYCSKELKTDDYFLCSEVAISELISGTIDIFFLHLEWLSKCKLFDQPESFRLPVTL